MGIESILKPVKWNDKQILKQYSKLTKKWEDKGHSRYSIAIPLTAYSFIMGEILNMNIFLIGGFLGWDMHANLNKTPYGTKDDVSSDVATLNPTDEFSKKIDRTVRLPLFVVGVGYIGKGIYGVVSSIVSGDNSELGSCVSDIGTGSSLFAMASSLYVKDIDLKLLDKEPFWKKVYNWAKEKASSLIPKPALEPVPVIVCSIENYV